MICDYDIENLNKFSYRKLAYCFSSNIKITFEFEFCDKRSNGIQYAFKQLTDVFHEFSSIHFHCSLYRTVSKDRIVFFRICIN